MQKLRTLVVYLLIVAVGWVPAGLCDGGKDKTGKEAPQQDKLPELTNSIGMKLMPIPAGEFLMGSADAEPGASEDEKPQHKVRITRPFYLGAFEVTQEEYERVMGTNSSFFSAKGHGNDRVKGMDTRRFPAEQVRWLDAVEFCRRLSDLPEEKKAGRVYRLPSEAEWEYACRAGTTTPFHFGKSLSSKQANFNGNNPFGDAPKGPFLVRTTKVGSYSPNAFGLYDLHGNVWEWCADWYGRTYYRESPTDDPKGPKSGTMRVIRGGEWYGDGRDCRSAFRYADVPTGIFYVMGLRVALDPPGKAAKTTADPESMKGALVKPLLGTKKANQELRSEDWPRWRGPRGDGTWHGPPLPDKWPAGGLKAIWRQPVGGGYAGVVVADGRAYVTDFHEGVGQPDRAAADKAASEPTSIERRSTERVLCFDADTGKPLWSWQYPVKYGRLSYGNGPRAAPTIFDDRIYTLGAMGHLFCLDAASGKVHWSRDLVKDLRAGVPGWGFSASPVIFEDLVIIHAGAKSPNAEPDGCFVALDRKTGQEIWRSLPDPAGYATPILISSQGKQQLACWTPTHVRGLEPHSGKLLWSIPFEVTYSTSIATPIFQENLILVSGYYEGSKAIRLGKDPTDATTATARPGATLAWHDRMNLRALMSQPLYRRGHVYLLDRRNGLTCFELKTGKKLWDDGNRMTPKGRNPQATLVWLGDSDSKSKRASRRKRDVNMDRAIILNSEGDLILARLSPAGYREDARTNIIGPTWAHPAYAGGCVYARSDTELVCVALVE